MFKKQVAEKEQVKLMIGITGPSGAGKTYSALQLAYGITGDWSKIVVADTENRSALYYAGSQTGPWEHIDFPPTIKDGYHPANWIKLIEMVEADPKTEVLILDSISHEWEAKGGALDINQKLGGKFTDWAKTTPIHNSFIDKLRTSRLHIIATMRVKTDYVVEQNEKGKNAPKKVGLKSIQREGTDYEFGIVFDIEVEQHTAIASKDRTGVFTGAIPFRISAETGKALVQWAKEGKRTSPIFEKSDPDQVKGLHEYLAKENIAEDMWPEIEDALDGKNKKELRDILKKIRDTSEVNLNDEPFSE